MRVTIDDVEVLMGIGGFKSYEEFYAWFKAPMEDWDTPDWEELALRELGCFESGSGNDDDPDVLAYMQAHEEMFLQEKVDRLIQSRQGRLRCRSTALRSSRC